MLFRVRGLAGRVEADPQADAVAEVDELGLRLAVMRRRIDRAGGGAAHAPAGDADLLAARRALADALAIVTALIGRLDPE